MPGNSMIKTQLMKSPHFYGVSEETKTGILTSIEFDLDETGFSRDELALGLRYLLAQNSQKYQDYIQPQPRTATYTPDLYFGVPNNTDWMLLYLLTNNSNSVHYHHHHHYYHGGGSSRRDSDTKCDGRAILIAALIAIACVCCCIGSYANYQTSQSNENQNLKTGKIIVSLILFLVAAIPAGIFIDPVKLLSGQPEPVTPDQVAAIKVSAAFFAGAAAYCVSAGLFALLPCVPRSPTVRPPSAELLAVLDPVKRLLDGDWVRPGDDPQQVVAFVKTVIRLHIDQLSKPEVVSTSEHTPLRKVQVDETKPTFALDHYLQPIPSAPELDDIDQYSLYQV